MKVHFVYETVRKSCFYIAQKNVCVRPTFRAEALRSRRPACSPDDSFPVLGFRCGGTLLPPSPLSNQVQREHKQLLMMLATFTAPKSLLSLDQSYCNSRILPRYLMPVPV